MTNETAKPTNVGSNDQLGLSPERAAFEAWAAQRWGREAHRHTSATCAEWDAWQAARVDLVAALQWYADGLHFDKASPDAWDTVDRGSLFRVVWGMSVVLDPRNRCVDPAADTIEHHPDAVAGLGAKKPRQLEDWHEDDGPALWWRFPLDEPPYCGHPNCDDWPGYHTHWTPLVVPDAPAVAVAAEAA